MEVKRVVNLLQRSFEGKCILLIVLTLILTKMSVVCVFYYNDVMDQSGRDWINCACCLWLHEVCAEDHEVDANGNNRFCLYCFDLLVFY